jgi:hypothetical protein
VLRRWVSCCERCERQVRVVKARERRHAARPARACENEDCGKVFEPTRTDARFCSVACKQRAYRRRVTDVDLHTRAQTKSRNAKGRKR